MKKTIQEILAEQKQIARDKGIEFDDFKIKQKISSREFWDSMNQEERKQFLSQTRNHDSWLKKNTAKNSDEIIRKKLSEKQLASWNDPNTSASRLTGMKAFWSSQEGKEFAEQKKQSKVWLDSVEKRSKDPKFGQAISKGKWKPICVPWGIYQSKRDAEIQGKLLDIKNIERKILKGLKDDPPNYFYISREDYIQLTGQNPFE